MTTAIALLALLVLLALALPPGLRRLFRPARTPGPCPTDLGLDAHDVAIPTERGKRLAAWYLPPASLPGPVVAVMHGWGSSAAELLPLAVPLKQAGYGVLLLDARCHGRSDDDDFASMPRFAEDLSHALDWLKARPEVASIAVIGHSVGGAAAILTASRRHDLAAVVAVSAFAHPRAMMRRWLKAFRIPYPVAGWWVLRYVERAIGHRYDDIAAINVVHRVACPLLLAHGRDDSQVPATDALAIHAARGTAHVEVLLLDDFGHGDPDRVAGLVPPLLDFLAGTTQPDGSLTRHGAKSG
ncbi:MAG TPA: alpha/beta fold hydrolase [Candidatus Omnitrophota bacterium]|nr:alpha/beta fold hydrolase [Candidatus Omnitrophota bacterium]